MPVGTGTTRDETGARGEALLGGQMLPAGGGQAASLSMTGVGRIVELRRLVLGRNT